MSVVSIWEILVKHKLGNLPLSLPAEHLINTMKDDGVTILQLRESAVLRLQDLPDLYRDPFDRLLICQALDGGLSIVTPDKLIKQYPVHTFW